MFFPLPKRQVTQSIVAGCTVLMSTHGAGEASACVTRAVRLVAGSIAEDSAVSGDPRAMLAAALAAHQEA